MMKESYYQNPHLKGSSFFLPGNEIGILLIHGFTATTVEVRKLAKILNRSGYTISAPLLPGHGTDPDDLNRTKYTEWTNSVLSAYYQLKDSYSKIIVGGESMGAVLAMWLCQEKPDINGLLLYSPALFVPKLKYAIFLKLFMKMKKKSSSEDDTSWQGYTIYPLKAAYEFLKLQKIVKSRMHLIHQPTIIMQGAFDQTIHSKNSKFIKKTISSDVVDSYFLLRSGHVMLLQNEISRIGRITNGFIGKFISSDNHSVSNGL
jgi:carboxylesterase